MLGLVAKAPTVSQEEGHGAIAFSVVANPLKTELICSGRKHSAPLRVSGRREAGSDASEPLRIVGGGCLQFLLPPPPVPAKMSDMEGDFTCNEEEDYDLEYSKDSNSEPNVGWENQYYNSKALKEDDPKAALSSFQKILELEGEKGEWGFKH